MIIDIIIIVLLISAVIRGREIGFVQQAFSTIGFFGGLLIGAAIEPYTVELVHTPTSRLIVTLVTTLGCAFLLLVIGEYVGIYLRGKVILAKLSRYDNLFGSLISVVSVLVGVWLGVALLRGLPYLSLQNELRSSRIVAALDRHLPAAPNVIADLGHLVDPNGFPRAFNGTEPSPPAKINLPPASEFTAALSKDRPSVVKLVGSGCGGIVEGSGFIVAPDIVATNAHVVAGIAQPYIESSSGSHPGQVIYFNPNLDFALIRTYGLNGSPLTVTSSTVNNSTPAAVLGYPGGGNFKEEMAEILDEFEATGSNIYDRGSTNRQIYEVAADIIPGNSGGPLITKNGTVVGIVFAQSTQYNGVGYALVTTPIVRIIHDTPSNSAPVSTGTCAG
ncbi:MarP family serine protease [Patescibacteria group bacterium]|nr:MarP family serine protease [Patescibacteria group bacterium]